MSRERFPQLLGWTPGVKRCFFLQCQCQCSVIYVWRCSKELYQILFHGTGTQWCTRTLSRLYADLMPAIRLRFSYLLYLICVNPGVGVLVVVGIVLVWGCGVWISIFRNPFNFFLLLVLMPSWWFCFSVYTFTFIWLVLILYLFIFIIFMLNYFNLWICLQYEIYNRN